MGLRGRLAGSTRKTGDGFPAGTPRQGRRRLSGQGAQIAPQKLEIGAGEQTFDLRVPRRTRPGPAVDGAGFNAGRAGRGLVSQARLRRLNAPLNAVIHPDFRYE